MPFCEVKLQPAVRDYWHYI